MITKEEFMKAGELVRKYVSICLGTMVEYKKSILDKAAEIASKEEWFDMTFSRYYERMVVKLRPSGKREQVKSNNAESLYCSGMAVGTMIKSMDGVHITLHETVYTKLE